jgi:hypothetical protein
VEAREAAADAPGGVAREQPLAPAATEFGDNLDLAHDVQDELGHIYDRRP